MIERVADSFETRLALAANAVEVRLGALLQAATVAGTPERLAAAMGHAVLAGGKRFRTEAEKLGSKQQFPSKARPLGFRCNRKHPEMAPPAGHGHPHYANDLVIVVPRHEEGLMEEVIRNLPDVCPIPDFEKVLDPVGSVDDTVNRDRIAWLRRNDRVAHRRLIISQ